MIFTGTGVVALGHQFYSWWSEEKAEEERFSDARSQHAQQLKCNRADAEQRQSEGREGSEKLNEYYNEEREGWYVGKGWKDNAA